MFALLVVVVYVAVEGVGGWREREGGPFWSISLNGWRARSGATSSTRFGWKRVAKSGGISKRVFIETGGGKFDT